MNKEMSVKKWLISFFVIIIIAIVILSSIAYIVDPYFQFRVKDNSYILTPWYVSAGLLKNYDYDTLIIGSSIIQNFNMDSFREKLNVKPLHIGIGGIRINEMNELIDLAYEVDKAKKFYIAVDLHLIAMEERQSRNVSYLLKDDFISNMQYLLSYEVWACYVPIDTVLTILKSFKNINFSDNIEYKMSIDKLGNWELEHEFGKEKVLKNYQKTNYRVSDLFLKKLYDRMTTQIDELLLNIDFQKGEYTFFFPPYSSLFWYGAQKKGYFYCYLDVKEYFIKKAFEYGFTVYDFQSADFTMDLNNYRDANHYSPQINEWMVDCFVNGEYKITEENYKGLQIKIIDNTQFFYEENGLSLI